MWTILKENIKRLYFYWEWVRKMNMNYGRSY